MKKRIALLLVLLLLFAFTVGCAKYADSPYVGEWVATSAEYMGFSLPVSEAIGGDMVFSLSDTGRCTCTIAGDVRYGKWAESDGGFTVDEELVFYVDGDVAVMELNEVTFTIEKQ